MPKVKAHCSLHNWTSPEYNSVQDAAEAAATHSATTPGACHISYPGSEEEEK